MKEPLTAEQVCDFRRKLFDLEIECTGASDEMIRMLAMFDVDIRHELMTDGLCATARALFVDRVSDGDEAALKRLVYSAMLWFIDPDLKYLRTEVHVAPEHAEHVKAAIIAADDIGVVGTIEIPAEGWPENWYVKPFDCAGAIQLREEIRERGKQLKDNAIAAWASVGCVIDDLTPEQILEFQTREAVLAFLEKGGIKPK